MDRDWYAVLGVHRGATQDEIRRAYRRKALELHPDRNGGSPEAEEAFKEVTAAYAVLRDPARRAAYDAGPGPGQGPGPDPADLFADLLRDPAFRALFSQLSREFGREGLRFDQAYLHRILRGGRGGVFFGGFVFAGPLGDLFSPRPRGQERPRAPGTGRSAVPRRPGLLSRLLGAALPRPAEGRDLHYTLPVAPELLARGGQVTLSLPGPSGAETLRVRIPAGASPGTRLRLAGKGAGTGARGDLFLELRPEGAGGAPQETPCRSS